MALTWEDLKDAKFVITATCSCGDEQELAELGGYLFADEDTYTLSEYITYESYAVTTSGSKYVYTPAEADCDVDVYVVFRYANPGYDGCNATSPFPEDGIYATYTTEDENITTATDDGMTSAEWNDVTDYSGMYTTAYDGSTRAKTATELKNGNADATNNEENDIATGVTFDPFTYTFESYCSTCGEKFTVTFAYGIFDAIEGTKTDEDGWYDDNPYGYTITIESGDSDNGNGYVPDDDWFDLEKVYGTFVWTYRDSWTGDCTSGTRVRTWTLSIETGSASSVFTFVTTDGSANATHSVAGGHALDSYGMNLKDDGETYIESAVTDTDSDGNAVLLVGGYVYDASAPEGKRLYYYEKLGDGVEATSDWQAQTLAQLGEDSETGYYGVPAIVTSPWRPGYTYATGR